MKNWCVVLDGQVEGWYASRAKARDYAAWLRRHPGTRDSVLFGPPGYRGRVAILTRAERRAALEDAGR